MEVQSEAVLKNSGPFVTFLPEFPDEQGLFRTDVPIVIGDSGSCKPHTIGHIHDVEHRNKSSFKHKGFQEVQSPRFPGYAQSQSHFLSKWHQTEMVIILNVTY